MLKIIKKNRNILRMPKAWVNVYLIFPLAIPLIKGLAKTKIKPNSVTLFSGFLALVAAVFFWQGTWVYLIIGAIVFYLSSVLDQVDGNFARIVKKDTKFGASFDGLTDTMRKVVCFIPLLYSQFYMRGGFKLLVLGIGLVFLHYGMHIIFNLLKYRKFELTKFGQRRLAEGVSPQLFSKSEEQFLIFIIGPIFNQVIPIFIISSVLFLFLTLSIKIKIALFGGKGW